MISDREKFKDLIETAKDPLAELSFSLNRQGYGAMDIATLFLQTGFLMIKTHYDLETTKEVCLDEIKEFEKYWRSIH